MENDLNNSPHSPRVNIFTKLLWREAPQAVISRQQFSSVRESRARSVKASPIFF
jgi:hypothetical protein